MEQSWRHDFVVLVVRSLKTTYSKHGFGLGLGLITSLLVWVWVWVWFRKCSL